jgi:hypothetical protein
VASKEEIAKLRARVVRVLATPACVEIRFKLASVQIRRFMYSYIAGLVEADRIHVDIGNNPGYDPPSKTLFMEGAGAPDATIVHESTHALINVTHAGQTLTKGVHETCAYVAEAFWALNADRDIAIDVPHVDIQAGRVARKARAFYASNKMGSYDVEPADYVYIQTLLKASALKMDADKKYLQIGICNGSN